MEPYIKCRTGRKFDYVNPTVEMVHVQDVAHAGANICRFNGHTRKFFSINQHMVEAAHLSWQKTADQALEVRKLMALCCLLHDAHEPYIGDWPSPLKMVFGEQFRAIERPVLHVVERAFNITQAMRTHREHVKQVDMELLWSDAIRWGMDGTTIVEDLSGNFVEVSDLREWVPTDAPVHFQDARPLPPDEAKQPWLDMFEKLGGVNRALYTCVGPVEARLAA